MESKQALEDIKGLLSYLNEDDLNKLIGEISYDYNVGIPQWYTPSKIRRMAEEGHSVSLTDDDIASIIEDINDVDPVHVNEIVHTHIELLLQ
jgi:hypothetical protein